MKKSSSDQVPFTDRIRSWARTHAYGGTKGSAASNTDNASAVNNQTTTTDLEKGNHNAGTKSHVDGSGREDSKSGSSKTDKSNNANADDSTAPASEAEGSGAVIGAIKGAEHKKPSVTKRFFLVSKKVLLHSWINVLLIFVPVGIAVANIPNVSAGAVFGINAVALIPLAALLSHATESVARKLGDTIGALLNVTFGNAVELIIFIIALVKNEIRIVQASLLGSILANLLLILGMAFFLGGLRFREQIYNSTVTQMSACLLSLSVISLVLPTAFHASFTDYQLADAESLKISRGTSVILLLVYLVYLAFQLKSHAYMYESTPQHIIDEESTPGPAATWLDTSSSDSSSSSDTDSDGSSSSGNTMKKRVKKAIRSRRRRKSSIGSGDTDDAAQTRASSVTNTNASPLYEGSRSGDSANSPAYFPGMSMLGNEELIEENGHKSSRSRRRYRRKHPKRKGKRHEELSINAEPDVLGENIAGLVPQDALRADVTNGETRRVDFAEAVTSQNVDGTVETALEGPAKRPFNNLRGLSFRPVAKSLAPAVFTQSTQPGSEPRAAIGPVPRVRYGIRRTNSLPERLNSYQYRPPGAMLPAWAPPEVLAGGLPKEEGEDDDLSKVSAIILLLVSTALVAVCAEFLVGAIDAVVEESSINETFIGLILLPIVGNAAEHVTAVTVAMKNKMDLAIGVAIGSSIQIALFLTPLIVILGWIIDREMTLYFTLFETVCLFVSAFIINFLILDGRSNYLEGALLVSTYVIIAVAAFFYPEGNDANEWGGGTG